MKVDREAQMKVLRRAQDTHREANEASPEVLALRAELDSIDYELLTLLERRFALSHLAILLKKASGKDARDPERERFMMRRASHYSARTRSLYQRIIDENVQNAESKLQAALSDPDDGGDSKPPQDGP